MFAANVLLLGAALVVLLVPGAAASWAPEMRPDLPKRTLACSATAGRDRPIMLLRVLRRRP
jgi:hypothetical protein